MKDLADKDSLFNDIKTLLQQARTHVVKAVNTTMVVTYFEIGRLIVEHEQKGNIKAKYGAKTMKMLSKLSKSNN